MKNEKIIKTNENNNTNIEAMLQMMLQMQQQIIQLQASKNNKVIIEKKVEAKKEKKPSKKAKQEGQKIKGMSGCFKYVEKEWTWIGGNTKEYKDKLLKDGFKYSGRRQQWYKVG